MIEQEQGLYYSSKEDSFRRVYPKASLPIISFDRISNIESNRWFDEYERRQGLREKVEDSYDYAKVEINSDRLVITGFTGDWHLGSNINSDLLRRDLDIMKHPLVNGVFFMGDLTDSANFNPAQDENYLSYEEQRLWLISILDDIGKDKILGMWKGNHDYKWERKHGTSKYAELSQRYEAPIFYGNAYIDYFVNSINYKLMGSHRLRGNSIYTNAHPVIRGHRETQGLDLVFAGHTHKKGYVEQSIKEFNGSRKIKGFVTGTYQNSTGYSKDSGFANQTDEQQGMYWVLFGYEDKSMVVVDSEEIIKFIK